MWDRLLRLVRSIPGARAPRPIPDGLWNDTLRGHPFLCVLAPGEQQHLRALCALFLVRKEFHGAGGLQVSDAMALAIAAQACLPLLHLDSTTQSLAWYDDFVGIVVHADEVVAPREVTDEIGVVHRYDEVLAGEAMPEGPVMLSWQDVAATNADNGYNVVIHEFVHKLDMRDGQADGCPPLPASFMGLGNARRARQYWLDTLHLAHENFREQVIKAERFGTEAPWLDPYGAESPGEFFAVASEAYFVNRPRFAREQPALLALFDAFYRPAAA